MQQSYKNWPFLTVLAAVLLWCTGIMALAVWKYSHFLYNAIDLAYFNQVFWNTVRGNLFGLTIHPHLSLGDHAEFFILLLAPLYALYQHPLTLIALQTLAIGSAAIPLFLLFKKRYGDLTGAGIALAYLFNPFIQQAALFEFHILPFFWSLFLWAFFLVEQTSSSPTYVAGGSTSVIPTGVTPKAGRSGGILQMIRSLGSLRLARDDNKRILVVTFIILIILILLIREDVALLVAAWGVTILLSGARPRYGWFLVFGGLGMFILDQLVIGHFQPTGSYKFLAYYGHLGHSWGEIIKNGFTNPGLIFSSLFRLNNFELLLGLLGSFLFLPALSWRFWILAAFPLLEFGLQTVDSRIVLQTHYQFLFWPAIVMGLHHSFASLLRLRGGWGELRAMTVAIFLFLTISLAAVYSPLGDFLRLQKIPHGEELLERALQQIPKDAGVVANYRLLPHLSSRRTVLATHYAHLGRQQYSQLPYEIPPEAEYIAFDLNDVWEYLFQYGRGGGWGKEALDKALQEWRTKLDSQGFKLVWAVENIQIWQRNKNVIPSEVEGSNPVKLLKQKPPASPWWHTASIDFGPLVLVSYEIAPASWGSDGVIAVRLLWQANGEVPTNTFVKFNDQLFSLSQNLLGPAEWQKSPYVETSFWLEQPFRRPGRPLTDRSLVLEVGTREIYLGMNFLGSGEVSVRQQQSWGELVLGGLPLTGR